MSGAFNIQMYISKAEASEKEYNYIQIIYQDG